MGPGVPCQFFASAPQEFNWKFQVEGFKLKIPKFVTRALKRILYDGFVTHESRLGGENPRSPPFNKGGL